MALLGAHVDSADPVTAGHSIGAEAIQFFLGDPQGWKAPPPHPHADEIKAFEAKHKERQPWLFA